MEQYTASLNFPSMPTIEVSVEAETPEDAFDVAVESWGVEFVGGVSQP